MNGLRFQSIFLPWIFLPKQQRYLRHTNGRQLEKTIVTTIAQALSQKTPVTLWTGQGKATFALNRRTNVERDLPKMIEQSIAPKGPSDFAVPVLAVRSPDVQLKAALFGYAVHASTLNEPGRHSGDVPQF